MDTFPTDNPCTYEANWEVEKEREIVQITIVTDLKDKKEAWVGIGFNEKDGTMHGIDLILASTKGWK